MSSVVPTIHLLCHLPDDANAFREAARLFNLPASINVEIHEYSLSTLPSSTKFDAVVSPANSFGILDGGFDDAISRAFSPTANYFALTRLVQATLYETWRGFAPPGTCTLVPFHFDEPTKNVWGCKVVAICPTMKVPQEVTWDREVVYECVWSLLCALDNHNKAIADRKMEGEKIESILMTPLATGCGFVSSKKWASQLVMAIKHYVQACENKEMWSRMNWRDLAGHTSEVKLTHKW